MAHTEKCFILFGMITALFVGCKKDKTSPPPPPEKKAVVSTIAGSGDDGYANGPALTAKFQSPVDVAIAPDGTIYVADYNNHRVRKIAGGEVTTFAGNDTFGILNGHGEGAKFEDPYRLAVDAAGNCYVTDQVDARIRKITPSADVTTYAGIEQPGFLNGPALTAQFQVSAGGIAVDGTGILYVGDTFNGRIRSVTVNTQVGTAAGDGNRGYTNGDGAIAQFRYPAGVACDRQGNVYIADPGNFCIRKLSTTGVVTTLAGTGVQGIADGDAATAQFASPRELVVDSQGNVYVTDQQRIRKVTPQGFVSTIAGSSAGFADGDGAAAKFKDPEGLGIDAQDNIYVADANNNRIRKISFQ